MLAWKSAAFPIKRVKTASIVQSLFSLPSPVSVSIIWSSPRSKQLNQPASARCPAIYLAPCLFPSPLPPPTPKLKGQQINKATFPSPLRSQFSEMIHILGGKMIGNRKCTGDTAASNMTGLGRMEVACFTKSVELGEAALNGEFYI